MKKENKIVYVTGCLGFIGSYVTRACLNKGWYVRGIDKITYASNSNLLEEFESWDTFTFEQTDINDLEFLYECDYVINTAAETHVGNSIVKSEEFMHSNINGVHNLLELIKNYRAEGKNSPILLHFSTDEVFGSLDIDDPPFTINSPYNPTNPYSATKCASDLLVSSFIKTYQFPAIIINTTNNYGSRQYHTKLIPKAIYNWINGIDMPIHDHGQHIRNWFFVKDCVKCIVRIINSKNGVGKKYTIGGNVEHSTIEMLRIIEKFYFQYDNNLPKPKYKYIEDRLMNDFRYSVSNIEYEDDYGKINYSNFEETLCQTVYDLIEGIISDEKNI